MGINGISVIINTAELTEDECKTLYKTIVGSPASVAWNDPKYIAPSLDGLKKGCHGRVAIEILGNTELIEVDIEHAKSLCSIKPKRGKIGAVEVTKFGLSAEVAPSDSIGLSFKISIDVSVDWGPLLLVFKGAALQVTYPSAASPSYHSTVKGFLEGVELSAATTALTLAGGLFIDKTDPLDMWGQLIVDAAGELGFYILGGYAEKDTGDSFFGFGYLKIPAEAMEPFQILGMAFGFGVNRDLVIPTVDKLDKFPFIQAAMSFAGGDFANPLPTDINDKNALISTLNTLGATTPAKPGTNWVAAGLAVSCANLIVNGFALVSMRFGGAPCVAAAGEIQVSVPPGPYGSTIKKTLFADYFFELVIDLSKGQLALDTYLKPNSFLLDPNLQLTGGTALRVWFGDNPKKGMWLLSCGGYLPSFDASAAGYGHRRRPDGTE